jgi:hypothetical protein
MCNQAELVTHQPRVNYEAKELSAANENSVCLINNLCSIDLYGFLVARQRSSTGRWVIWEYLRRTLGHLLKFKR